MASSNILSNAKLYFLGLHAIFERCGLWIRDLILLAQPEHAPKVLASAISYTFVAVPVAVPVAVRTTSLALLICDLGCWRLAAHSAVPDGKDLSLGTAWHSMAQLNKPIFTVNKPEQT